MHKAPGSSVLSSQHHPSEAAPQHMRDSGCGSELPAESRSLAAAYEALQLPSIAAAATGSALPSPKPAGTSEQQQQQDAASDKHGYSAGAAQESGPGQHQGGLYWQRALYARSAGGSYSSDGGPQECHQDGTEAAVAARENLVSNNAATGPFLNMLQAAGHRWQLLTLQHVEQEAFSQVLESLTLLAKQCKAVHVQPLGVFMRSVERVTHKRAADSIATRGCMYDRQKRIGQLSTSLARFKGQMESVSAATDLVQALKELGVDHCVVFLIIAFLQVLHIGAD